MDPKVFVNTKVCEITGVKETVGPRMAVELELEGRGVGLQDVPCRGWHRHPEPSLRGESIEFVSAAPGTIEALKKSVTALFQRFEQHNVHIKDSMRTSTHVHMNFSDVPLKTAINFFTLFTLVEEVLQYYCGDGRKGSNFCIAAREADAIMHVLSQCMEQGNLSSFARDRYKYGACNLSTLYKYGSIEVRLMRGANSAEQVNKWIDILNDMYEYSLNKMKSPVELVAGISVKGADELMREIFSEQNYRELMNSFPKVVQLPMSLLEGARLFQVFAYEFDELFQAEMPKPKPVVKKKEEKLGRGLPRETGGEFSNLYQIYKPDGLSWYCNPGDGLDWINGRRVVDDMRIQWSDEFGRFIVHYPDGRIIPCNWANHPVLGDEHAPGVRVGMPFEDFDGFNEWGVEEYDEGDFNGDEDF